MQPLPTRQQGPRTAFTLIELLVVIAIVAILIGLLVPAVQLARTAVNRTVSGNNMHQIGVAIHNFHDNRNSLPYNGLRDWWGWAAQPDSGSWGFQILPYLDENQVYTNTTSIHLPSGNIIGPIGVRVAAYCDPERDRPTLNTELDVARAGPTTDYAMNCWINALPGDDVTGAPNRRKRLDTIPDGTSTTCIIGFEALAIPDYDQQVSNSWNESWYTGGYGGSGRDGFSCLQDTAVTDEYIVNGDGVYGSPYANACCFLFCDGAVHWYMYGTDLT